MHTCTHAHKISALLSLSLNFPVAISLPRISFPPSYSLPFSAFARFLSLAFPLFHSCFVSFSPPHALLLKLVFSLFVFLAVLLSQSFLFFLIFSFSFTFYLAFSFSLVWRVSFVWRLCDIVGQSLVLGFGCRVFGLGFRIHTHTHAGINTHQDDTQDILQKPFCSFTRF